MATSARSVKKLKAVILATCIAGFAVSYYAYHVEVAKEQDDSYVATCDISEHVSCTKAFSSTYGKGFGIIPEDTSLYMANSIYGLIFYTLVAILSMSNRYVTSALVVFLGTCANICTIYLISISYILRNICIVCVSTYIINGVLLMLAIKKHINLFGNGTNQKKKSN